MRSRFRAAARPQHQNRVHTQISAEGRTFRGDEGEGSLVQRRLHPLSEEAGTDPCTLHTSGTSGTQCLHLLNHASSLLKVSISVSPKNQRPSSLAMSKTPDALGVADHLGPPQETPCQVGMRFAPSPTCLSYHSFDCLATAFHCQDTLHSSSYLI